METRHPVGRRGNATAILNSISNCLARWAMARVRVGRSSDPIGCTSGRFLGSRGTVPVSVAGGRAPAAWWPRSAENPLRSRRTQRGSLVIYAPSSVKGNGFMSREATTWLGHGMRVADQTACSTSTPTRTRATRGPVIGPENRPHYDHVTIVFNLFEMLHRGVKRWHPGDSRR